MASRRYQPRPYRTRPVYSRRPAGSYPPYRQRTYRPYPNRRRPPGGGFLAALLDLFRGR
jgi:hypothetical protein